MILLSWLIFGIHYRYSTFHRHNEQSRALRLDTSSSSKNSQLPNDIHYVNTFADLEIPAIWKCPSWKIVEVLKSVPSSHSISMFEIPIHFIPTPCEGINHSRAQPPELFSETIVPSTSSSPFLTPTWSPDRDPWSDDVAPTHRRGCWHTLGVALVSSCLAQLAWQEWARLRFRGFGQPIDSGHISNELIGGLDWRCLRRRWSELISFKIREKIVRKGWDQWHDKLGKSKLLPLERWRPWQRRVIAKAHACKESRRIHTCH